MQIPKEIQEIAVLAVKKTGKIVNISIDNWSVTAHKLEGDRVLLNGVVRENASKIVDIDDKLNWTAEEIYAIVRPASKIEDFIEERPVEKLERSRTLKEFFRKINYDLFDWPDDEQIEMAKNLGLKHNV